MLNSLTVSTNLEEMVVSCEGAMELEFQETEVAEQTAEKTKNLSPAAAAEAAATAAGTCSSSEVRWERFLPKMAVRVLLVEADDSTRQIVAALLRKCSYKVAAVADGLKAWEILKGQSHNIDLILTEVELPSISGYALLTLIMEHHKNIPVIMMSSNDSLSTVYKCMLRGAADFLVKPIRKNELRNLWQHVWRKQASAAAGPGPPDETAAQQKLEATAENNATSNHSSGYMTCIQRNRECIEKGSDTQSSCTKPDLGTEEADIELVHCLSHVKAGQCLSDDKDIYRQDESHQGGGETEDVDNEAREYLAMASIDANRGTTQREDKNSSDGLEQDNVTCQNSDNVPEHCSREAIDLLGNFGTFAASNVSANKFDISPLLDLSLRRSHPSGSVNQVNDEPHRLNHSDASAFSRYINNNKISQPGNSTSASTCNQQKYPETNSEKQQSNHIPDYNSDTRGPRIKLSETTFSYSQRREISEPVPVRGSRFENVINGGFGSLRPQVYGAQSGLSPSPSPGTVNHSQSSIQQQFHNLLDHRASGNTIDQPDCKQGQTLENFESVGHVSPSNDQSGNSSFCNGNINSISVVKAVSECGNEESLNVQEGSAHRSMQREAALTKFRLKRKERCFEKKVRYESRKQLAEQRPRVKGQFVRQVPNDPQPGSSLAS